MNFIGHHKPYNIQCLLEHTEGKLKAYESCCDVRAWSHDLRKRDRYLREWIKCDMPPCFVPITTLIGFFSAMTCRSRGKATPRCHPDCKSKIILESISSSCDAIKECLKADRNFGKYICEEEFETTHWPCERCLEALKSIKVFWKMLLEKVFAVNLTKNECFEDENFNCESVRDVARHWEREMVQQAIFVKSITPQLCANTTIDKCCKKSCLKRSNSVHCISPPYCAGDKPGYTIVSSKCPQKKVTLNCLSETVSTKRCKSPPKGTCKCKPVRVKTCDASCGSNNDDDCDLRTSISYLQRTNCSQREEIERLKQENNSLRCELQNLKNCKWKPSLFCATALIPNKDNTVVIPKPFESYVDNSSSKTSTKGADSEVLITMKKCKHDSFKHVSLLQVLHKTNDPKIQENYADEPCYKNEDPIVLLTKVQETLGAMVKREMALAKTKKHSDTDSEIEASFQRVSGSRFTESEVSYQTDN